MFIENKILGNQKDISQSPGGGTDSVLTGSGTYHLFPEGLLGCCLRKPGWQLVWSTVAPVHVSRWFTAEPEARGRKP